MSRHAFTLIELLVVISIIAVLAGMLLPAVNLVRRSAQAATCASQLRQIGLAISQYTNDQEGVFPPSSITGGLFWRRLAAPYLYPDKSDTELDAFIKTRTVFSCPTALADHPGGTSKATYGQNRYMDPGMRLERRSQCQATSATLLAADGHWDSIGGWWATSLNPDNGSPPDAPHRTRATCLYVDGHVEAIPATAIPSDPLTPPGQTFWRSVP